MLEPERFFEVPRNTHALHVGQIQLQITGEKAGQISLQINSPHSICLAN